MGRNKILLVALDGLDKELIKEFDLEHVKQEEFGSIDNKTGISAQMTSELFTSFITGKNYEEHGVKGLQKDLNPKRQKIVDILAPESFAGKIRGFDFLRRNLEKILGIDRRKYKKEDIEAKTLFEELENSRAMFVPGYNPSILWTMMGFGKPLKYGYTSSEILRMWDEQEYEYRKEELFSELENPILEPRDFLMCHFHRPDTHHHFFEGAIKNRGQADEDYGKSKLKKLYQETDQLAKEIKEKAEEKGYDYIIFMSDHGLPTENEHNENAFYSSNKKLFGDKTPKITDFHDKILDISAN
jgi:hypothetical protein